MEYTCTGISSTGMIEVDNPVVTAVFGWNAPNLDGFYVDMAGLWTSHNVECRRHDRDMDKKQDNESAGFQEGMASYYLSLEKWELNTLRHCFIFGLIPKLNIIQSSILPLAHSALVWDWTLRLVGFYRDR